MEALFVMKLLPSCYPGVTPRVHNGDIKRPGALLLSFPFRHPGGTGLSGLLEGERTGADRARTGPGPLRQRCRAGQPSMLRMPLAYAMNLTLVTPSVPRHIMKGNAVVAIGVHRGSVGRGNGPTDAPPGLAAHTCEHTSQKCKVCRCCPSTLSEPGSGALGSLSTRSGVMFP
jgi:hypothetical protein